MPREAQVVLKERYWHVIFIGMCFICSRAFPRAFLRAFPRAKLLGESVTAARRVKKKTSVMYIPFLKNISTTDPKLLNDVQGVSYGNV